MAPTILITRKGLAGLGLKGISCPLPMVDGQASAITADEVEPVWLADQSVRYAGTGMGDDDALGDACVASMDVASKGEVEPGARKTP